MQEMTLKQRVAMDDTTPDLAPVDDDEDDDLLSTYDAARRTALARRRKWRYGCGCALLTAVLLVAHALGRQYRSPSVLKLATWNIAAINNNPFEYWITHDDPKYNALMKSVQEFIDSPGERDVPVSHVFTPARWEELKARMVGAGWSGVDATEQFWTTDYSSRKIVSGFLKDAAIGEKRLASMPDRVTNTINTASGVPVYRPTVRSCRDLAARDCRACSPRLPRATPSAARRRRAAAAPPPPPPPARDIALVGHV